MPLREIVLPELGFGDQSAKVSLWLAKQGESVEEGEPLVEILCGAATFDVSAKASGVLVKKLVETDESVRVGQALAMFETEA